MEDSWGAISGGGLTKRDSDWGNLQREDFPGTNSVNGHPPLNMWECFY